MNSPLFLPANRAEKQIRALGLSDKVSYSNRFQKRVNARRQENNRKFIPLIEGITGAPVG